MPTTRIVASQRASAASLTAMPPSLRIKCSPGRPPALWPSRPTISETLRCPARIRGSIRRKSIGKRLSLTVRVCAPPAAQPKLNRYCLSLDRQILKAPVGPAMPISSPPAAIRANAEPWTGSGNNPTVIRQWARHPGLLHLGRATISCSCASPPIAASCLTVSEPQFEEEPD